MGIYVLSFLIIVSCLKSTMIIVSKQRVEKAYKIKSRSGEVRRKPVTVSFHHLTLIKV
jgi:hypothetical protein